MERKLPKLFAPKKKKIKKFNKLHRAFQKIIFLKRLKQMPKSNKGLLEAKELMIDFSV